MQKEVRWLDWDKAVSSAKKKPILLGISAVWCHWCHQMDKLTYSDGLIADYINKNFIPIRVDTDKRPDINAKYNMGGWPSTLVLAPDLTPVLGETYVPPEQMMFFLEEGISRWKAYKPGKKQRVKERTETLHPQLANALDSIKQSYDPINGGFGTEPKFPQHDTLQLLTYLAPKNHEARGMLHHTLLKMSAGEICDAIEGGFYRYATQQDWSYPHFEKMLEDNAQLLKTYLDAYAITKEHRFRQVAEQMLSFLFSRMQNRNKTFAGSQDADEAYCHLPLSKRKHPPFIDRTAYTGWNALAVSALWKAYSILQWEEYRKAALDCLLFLRKEMLTTHGIKHYYDGEAHGPLLLEDVAPVLHALLDTYEQTAEQRHIDRAEKLVKESRKLLCKNGAWKSDEFTEKTDTNQNSLLALAFLRLSAHTGKEAYATLAKHALEATPGTEPLHALAVELALSSLPLITVVGEGKTGEGFLKHVLRAQAPWLAIEYLSPSDHSKLNRKGYAPAKLPSAFICNKTCKGPFTDPEAVLREFGYTH